MSVSVDNRIVQMTFDNKQFESAIKQSMDSLKDLDKTIEKAGAGGKAGNAFGNFFDKLKELKNGISLSSIADGVDSLRQRFSTWGIVGMTVIQNLTNGALNFAKRGLSAINDALFGGGWQRAANLEAANFRLEAILGSAKKVKKVMEDVDWAVTGTAYGLDEAAVAASMFAATNVKAGTEMRTALRAVAGVASTFAIDFQQVSNIFTDASARGAVMNDTFTRLSMQGVPALQVMSKVLGKTTDEVKDMAKDGKISFKEFAKAMDDAYGKHAQDANKTFTGALANMKTALKRMTEPFFTAFRNGARDTFNALRDGINNFGDAFRKQLPGFEAAMGSISEKVVGLIKKLTSAQYIVTDLGKKIKRPSTFKKFGYVITGTLKGIILIFESIKKAFDNVFGGSAFGRINSFIDVLFNLEERFLKWAKTQTIVQTVFTGLFRVIEVGIHIFDYLKDAASKVISVFSNIAQILAPLGRMVADVTGTFLNLIDVFVKALNKLDIFGRLGSAIQKAFGLIQKFLGSAFETILGIIQDFGKTAIDSMDHFMDLMVDVGIIGWIVSFTDFIDKAAKLLKKGKGLIDTVDKSIKALVKIPKQIVGILNEVRKSLKAWQEQLKATVLLELAAAVFILSRGIKALSEVDGKALARSLGAIVFMFGMLIGVMKIWDKIFKPAKMVKSEKGIKGILQALVHEVKPNEMDRQGTAMIKFSVAIYIMAKALNSIAKLSIGELATGIIGIGVLLGMLIATAKLLSTNDRLLDRKRIQKGMGGIVLMAISIKIMASALAQLAGIPWDNLDNALAAMSLILTEVVGFSVLMSRSSKGLEGGASAKSFIMLAISMKIMASALGDLAKIDWDSLQNALAAMGLVLFELGMFGAAASKLGGMKGGASLIAMAAGIYIIAKALTMLSSLSWEQMNNEMNILIILLMTLTGVMLAADFGGKGAVALIALAVALNLLTVPLVVLSGIPIDNLATALLALVTTLTVVGVAMAVFSAALVPMLMGALALTAASVSIGIFAAALMGLGLAMSAIGVGLTAIASGILAIYTVIKKIFSEIINFIGDIIGKIAEFVSGGGEEIDKSAHELEKNAENVGASVASGLKKAIIKKIRKAFGEFKSSGVKIITNLASGVKSKITSIATSIGSGIKKAKEKATGFVSDFLTAGKNLVSGIARGISNGASSVISSAGSIARKALNKFKSMLGISSPSKEFAKASRWIPEGIVVGIDKTSSKVSSSVEKLAKSTVNPFGDAMKKAYSILEEGEDFNPTITPILDLTKIKKEASGISSIFGKESVPLAASMNNVSTQREQEIKYLADKLGKILDSQTMNRSNITNNFTVNNANNPEDFAYRVMRSLEAGARVI